MYRITWRSVHKWRHNLVDIGHQPDRWSPDMSKWLCIIWRHRSRETGINELNMSYLRLGGLRSILLLVIVLNTVHVHIICENLWAKRNIRRLLQTLQNLPLSIPLDTFRLNLKPFGVNDNFLNFPPSLSHCFKYHAVVYFHLQWARWSFADFSLRLKSKTKVWSKTTIKPNSAAVSWEFPMSKEYILVLSPRAWVWS